ncbi:MAG: DUF4595 domain-containing protein [Prevotella sp.]|nr:DUF4595 domain-containing protein [Prevotella sp.]
MKKYCLLTMLLAFFAFTLFAQTGYEMVVVKNDGTKIRINTSEVKHTYFQKIEIDASNAVDLGLPSGTKWANMNIGAYTKTDYGTYFAWGETTGYTVVGHNNIPAEGNTKTEFSWATYKWCNGNVETFTKYINTPYYDCTVDYKTVLELSDDAAFANWGAPWRMPTKKEFEELMEHTTKEWVDNYNNTGVAGYKFTGTNGNSIFLPAAGYFDEWGYYGWWGHHSDGGYYWSSSIPEDRVVDAWNVNFSSTDISMGLYGYRYHGLSIRPVCDGESDGEGGSDTSTINESDLVGTWKASFSSRDEIVTLNSEGSSLWKVVNSSGSTTASGTFTWTLSGNTIYLNWISGDIEGAATSAVISNVTSNSLTAITNLSQTYNFVRTNDEGNDETPGTFQGAKRIFGNSLLNTFVDDNESFTYHYDENGFATQIDYTNYSGSRSTNRGMGGGSTIRTYTITYGDNIVMSGLPYGTCTATIESHGFIGKINFVDDKGNAEQVKFSYNDNEQLTAVDYGDGDVFYLTYNNDGDVIRVTNYSDVYDIAYETSSQSKIPNTGNVMEFDKLLGIDMDDFNALMYIGALGKATKHLPLSITHNGTTTNHTWTCDSQGRATQVVTGSHTFQWGWDSAGSDTPTINATDLIGTWKSEGSETSNGTTYTWTEVMTFNSDNTGESKCIESNGDVSEHFYFTWSLSGNTLHITPTDGNYDNDIITTFTIISVNTTILVINNGEKTITWTKDNGEDNPDNPSSGTYQGARRIFGNVLLGSIYNVNDNYTDTFTYDNNGFPTKITSNSNNKNIEMIPSYSDGQIIVRAYNANTFLSQYIITIGDKGYASKVEFTDDKGNPEVLYLSYNDNEQLSKIQWGEDANDIYQFVYSDRDVIRVEGSDGSWDVYYESTTQSKIQNLGNFMLWDEMLNVDMDDLEALHFWGLLGKSTTHLPLSYAKQSSSETRYYTNHYETDSNGRITQFYYSRNNGGTSEYDSDVLRMTWNY